MIGEFSLNRRRRSKNTKFILFKTGTAFVLFCLMLASKTYGVASDVEQYLNPEWIEPHAWANEKDPLQKLCPQAPIVNMNKDCDKRNIEIAFKKLIRNFFDRSKFMVCMVTTLSFKYNSNKLKRKI